MDHVLKYKFTKFNDRIRIEKDVEIDKMIFTNTKHISFEEARELFYYLFKNCYIARERKITCTCSPCGITLGCEVCEPDDYKDSIFKDDLTN